MITFENKSFYLETKNTSYVMRILDNGILSNAYYGKKIGRCNMKAFSVMKEMGYSPLALIDGKHELDVNKLSKEEVDLIPKQVEEHRNLEPLIATGDYYRLMNPFVGNQCAWELVSEDKEKAYVMFAAASIRANDKAYVIKPKGLNPEYVYQVSGTDIVADGTTIMNVGIPIVDALGEYETRTFYITKN